MKKQFESLNSDKFSEQKLSIEAMMKQRGGKTFDTTEHNGDHVSYVYGNGKYYKQTYWGNGTDCKLETSDTMFRGTTSDMYSSAGA